MVLQNYFPRPKNLEKIMENKKIKEMGHSSRAILGAISNLIKKILYVPGSNPCLGL